MQHESILRRNDTLFLIIDIQQGLVPVVSENEEVLKKSTIIAKAANILDIPLIISEQYPQGLGATVDCILENTPKDTQIFAKTSFSCLQSETINKALRKSGASQVVICGIEAHICVAQTALDLAATGMQVQVLADAVSSRAGENKANALARLARAGITISNTESALFELLGVAKGDDFKAISKLIK